MSFLLLMVPFMFLNRQLIRKKSMSLKNLFFIFIVLGCFVSVAENGNIHFNFQTQADWYISPKAYSEQLNQYWIASSQIKTKQQYKYIYYDFNMTATISLDATQRYFFSIPYANFGYHLKDISTISFLKSFQASLGRYKKQWSWLDSYWELGLWNPRNLFDYFNPEELGMLGSTILFKGNYWSLTSFIGGLFLPNEQTSIGKNKAGSIESKSRWGTPPATNISILNKELDAYYWIQKTYLTGVIFQRNYNINFFLGDKEDKWLSLSYAQKPLNNIFYRIKSGISISGASLDSSIYHHALTHQLISIDTGFRWDDWSVYIGLLDETLDRINLPQNWIVPNIPHTILFYSASIKRDINFVSWNQNSIRLSFLNSWTKQQQHISLIGGTIDSLISLKRLKIKSGWAMDWITNFKWSNKKEIKSFLRYWYDFSNKGGWLQWKLSYFISPQFWFLLECNVLGSENKMKENFFTWFGNNDRLSLKVQYGF